MFFKGSRYENVEEHMLVNSQGAVIRYKKARFIAPTPAARGHTVSQGERLDHIAYRYFRDPEQFWRICDANLALWPDDLTADPEQTIRIPASGG